MIYVYPYIPKDPEGELNRGRPKNRLEIQQARLRQDRMNILANQLPHDEQDRIAGKLDMVRAAIGGALIAVGERIGQESMRRRQARRDAARYDNVRHA